MLLTKVLMFIPPRKVLLKLSDLMALAVPPLARIHGTRGTSFKGFLGP